MLTETSASLMSFVMAENIPSPFSSRTAAFPPTMTLPKPSSARRNCASSTENEGTKV
jgi:hypothetical protein